MVVIIYFRLHHVKENFLLFTKSNKLAFCTHCRFDTDCFVNANCLRSILIVAYYGDLLKKLGSKKTGILYPTLPQSEYNS